MEERYRYQESDEYSLVNATNYGHSDHTGYRTVSLQAALTLSDLMQIVLKLTMLSANYLARNGTVSVPFVLGNLQRPLWFDEFHHPADAGVILNCSIQHDINIFTDGSKLDGKTGCALISYEGDGVIPANCYRLADVCTVFQAELLAILKACEWAANESRSIKIHSDSQSSIQTIRNFDSRNRMAKETPDYLTSNKHICIEWVRTHVGVDVYKAADELAKGATLLDVVSFDIVPLSAIKAFNRNYAMEESYSTGRLTRKFFPSICS